MTFLWNYDKLNFEYFVKQNGVYYEEKSVCILLIFAAVIVLTYVTGESYYRGISEKAGLDKQEEKIYKYQYDMIVDSPDSQFWQAVYDSAKKKQLPIMY